VAWRRKFSDGPAATGPRLDKTMGILPYFRRPDHLDLKLRKGFNFR
jgi:hypothetical protein